MVCQGRRGTWGRAQWVVAAALIACKPTISTVHVRVTHEGGASSANESGDAATRKSIEKNCLGGAPVLELDFGETSLIGRSGYAVGHSNDLKIPLWVCEQVSKADLRNTCPRKDSFKADKSLPVAARAANKDYLRSGFDRGHMAPAENFSHSCAAMSDSFYLSNMAPQIGRGFNQHVWAWLEARVRAWVVDYEGAWLVTGPIFHEDDDGLYCASTIGQGQVGVPAAFYKAVVVQVDGEYLAVGFILDNEAHAMKLADHGDFSQYAVSIDEIEERTGIDLFADLPSNVQTTMESASPSSWSW